MANTGVGRVSTGARKCCRASGALQRPKGLPFSAWHQSGIYELYDHFKIVYVGQADNSRMGARLSDHCRDRFSRRWDFFSWFGLSPYDAEGKPMPYEPVRVEAPSVIRSLELLGIILSDTPLNRSRGRFEGAEKIVQQTTKIKSTDQKTLDMILKKLDNLAERI